MTNSRAKGKNGELEWCHWLRDNLGVAARRGQQFKGTPDSPDVICDIDGIHWEVKRVEKLNLKEAVKKAIEDSGEAIPVVAHRQNRGEWLLTFRASDLKGIVNIMKNAKWEGE